jgi:Protein of unknown function (DUF1153)
MVAELFAIRQNNHCSANLNELVAVPLYRRVWLDTVIALKSNTLASAA